MGIAVSLIKRPFKNFNVESRAHKFIDKDKTAAPKHVSDAVHLEKMMEDYPDVYKESLKKHDRLDKHLKNVFVTSFDPMLEKSSKSTPTRPLPLDKSIVQDFEYGFKVPAIIPTGKVTLKTAMDFISNYQQDPKKYNISQIANTHNLDENTVANVLKYYKIYEIYVPQERNTKTHFAGPSVKRIKVERIKKQQLESNDKNESNIGN